MHGDKPITAEHSPTVDRPVELENVKPVQF